MSRRLMMTAAVLAAAMATGTAQQRTVMVGGEAMFPSRTIVANAMNSNAHTTLVAAVKAAGLAETLQGPGPFTVFAPTNAAFDALPDGTVEALLKPENKAKLVGVLSYHVVAGRLDADALWQRVRAGSGTAELETVSGGRLWVMANGPKNLVIKDENGGLTEISTYDVYQANGVIHVITDVLMPG